MQQLFSALLQEMVSNLHSDSVVLNWHQLPILPGYSGSFVGRFEVFIAHGNQQISQKYVIKEASLRERKVLSYLNDVGHFHIPKCYAPDLIEDGLALVCLQDLGNVERPEPPTPISLHSLRKEAGTLAKIHARNRDLVDKLDWLPKMEEKFLREELTDYWWNKYDDFQSNNDFFSSLGIEISKINALSEVIFTDMKELCMDKESLSLIHADNNPRNVLIHKGDVYLIDWETAHFGPIYFDIPYRFYNIELALVYYRALQRQGWEMTKHSFMERYRVASRYIGITYLWHGLARLRAQPSDTSLAQYYLAMINC